MSEIELHRKLLGDRVRNAAIARALQAVLKPGKTVLADVGAGTGYIAFLARRLGAKECHLYEYSPALALARRLAKTNGIDGLKFFEAHSTEVENAPAADVVFSETLGNYALEEGLLETLLDARRFLKPGGVMVPCGLRQFVAPVVTPWIQDELDVWGGIGGQLDFGEARRTSLNNMYVRAIRPGDLGDTDRTAQLWDRLSFAPEAEAAPSVRTGRVHWTAGNLPARTVHGLALWWEADLVPGVMLSTSPFAPTTHWQQVYLPLLDPVTLADGDELAVDLTSDTRPDVGVNVAWTVKHERGGRVHAKQSLDLTRGRL